MHNAVHLSSHALDQCQTSARFIGDILRDDPPIFHTCEMPHPVGAPSQICLYADFSPPTRETPIYLCNPTTKAIANVCILIEWISMHQFYHADVSERWSAPLGRNEQHLDSLGAGRAILIAILDHEVWNIVSCYRLGFLGANGVAGWMSACDLTLNACRLGRGESGPWVEFHCEPAATLG